MQRWTLNLTKFKALGSLARRAGLCNDTISQIEADMGVV